MYIFRKPKAIPIESTNKIRSIYTLRERIANLLKVVLFHSNQFCHIVDGAFPTFIPDYKRILQGLSIEVSFDSELSLKGGQTTQNNFPKICCTKIYVHQCKGPSTYDIRFFWPFLTYPPTHIRFLPIEKPILDR